MTEILNQRYKVYGQLGRGGFGEVSEGLDLILNRPVAIKRLHGFNLSDVNRERFLDEARVTSQLTHRCTLTLFDFGVSESGDPFLVTELLKGVSLHDYLKTHRLSLPQTIHLMREVGEALYEAHSLGVVHRDIKPANVFLHCPSTLISRGEVKMEIRLLDFGIAKVLAGASVQTHAGLILGTPAYMAPEQIKDSAQVDHRCDLYSLGLVAWHALQGETPYQAHNEYDLMRKQVDEPLPDLDLSKTEAHDGFRAILSRLTHKKREARYDDAMALIDALDLLCDDHSELNSFEPIPPPKGLLLETTSRPMMVSGGAVRSIDDLIADNINHPPRKHIFTHDSGPPNKGATASTLGVQGEDYATASTLGAQETPATTSQAEDDYGEGMTLALQQSPKVQRVHSPIPAQDSPTLHAPLSRRGLTQRYAVTSTLIAFALCALYISIDLDPLKPESTSPQPEAPHPRPVSITPVTPSALPKLGPKRSSARFKIQLTPAMPISGYDLGEEVEVNVIDQRGQPLLGWILERYPTCFRPISDPYRKLFSIASTQCGTLKVSLKGLSIEALIEGRDGDPLLLKELE